MKSKFVYETLNLLNSDEPMSNSVIRHGNVRFVSLRLIFPMGADIRDIIETWAGDHAGLGPLHLHPLQLHNISSWSSVSSFWSSD